MQVINVAVVSESKLETYDFTHTAILAAALQQQVTRDFSPLWNVYATVSAFEKLDHVPQGYWPIIIRDESDVRGAHQDRLNQPFAIVRTRDNDVPLSCSHELLEMLVDPYLNRLVTSLSLRVNSKGDHFPVEYLVEICDPCGGFQFGYPVNGLVLCDFVTPRYFDDTQFQCTRYSFTGAVTAPKQILPGGYLTWYDRSIDRFVMELPNNISQNLPAIAGDTTLREIIDSHTSRLLERSLPEKYQQDRKAVLETRKSMLHLATKAGELTALGLRRRIQELQ